MADGSSIIEISWLERHPISGNMLVKRAKHNGVGSTITADTPSGMVVFVISGIDTAQIPDEAVLSAVQAAVNSKAPGIHKVHHS